MKFARNERNSAELSLKAVSLRTVLFGMLLSALLFNAGPILEGLGAQQTEADNCPGVHNPEQLDQDNDGVGDECDITVILRGNRIPGVIRQQVNRESESRKLTIAYVDNATSRPGVLRLEASNNTPWLQITERVVIQGNTLQAVQITVLPQFLSNGHNSARLMISLFEVDGTVSSLEVILDLIAEILSADKECEFEIRTDTVKVTDGQGVAEGKLELRLVSHADGVSSNWPSGSGTYKVAEGVTVSVDDKITRIVVPEGSTKTVDIKVEVHSNDGGTTGSDDYGLEKDEMILECGKEPASVSLTITLPGRALLENEGKVKVIVEGDQV